MIYKLLDWKCGILVLVTTATEANSSTIIWYKCVTLDEVLPNLNTLKVMWLLFIQ